MLIQVLSIFWFLRQKKAILFWLYLWQLKEYHIGRFVDHFRTYKGKRVFFNYLFIFKFFLGVVLLALYLLSIKDKSLLIFYEWFIIVLTVLYFFESLKFFKDFAGQKIIKPVFTKKIIILALVVIFFEIFYYFSFIEDKTLIGFDLLFFDISTPLIVSGIVLVLQPIAVLLRGRIVNRAKSKREKFKNLTTIGITGSYGKTSTKEILATILREKYGTNKILKTKAHQNSEIGISNCILDSLDKNHEIFIAEMGAYNRGGIKLLAGIVKPRIGILTGINEQHMALFGSIDNTIKAKYELIDSLPKGGIAVLNANNEIIRDKKINFDSDDVRLCSSREKLDMWAEDISFRKETVSFKILSKDGDSAFFNIHSLGRPIIDNILMSAAVAKELGMNLGDIARACSKIKQEQGSMDLINTEDGFNIIDSTYSSNPTGVLSHLEYLKVWSGKKAIIMPCLIELGSASSKIHTKIGSEIGKTCDLAIITTRDRLRELREGAESSGLPQEKIIFSENPQFIFDKLKDFSSSEDIILLEGRVSSQIKDLWKLKK